VTEPDVLLTFRELDALRRVAEDGFAGISAVHINVLAGMGLIEMDSTGALMLTEAGRLRLRRAAPARLRGCRGAGSPPP
jgi:hypothetical protein